MRSSKGSNRNLLAKTVSGLKHTEQNSCHYASGNGLFLSWRAMKFYMQATDLLRRTATDVPDNAVRKAFSLLRTQMKLDIAVYTSDEAAAPVAAESHQPR
jgi:hypothetical protein